MADKNISSGQESINSYLTELSVKISELEEKQRLLKDRLLLIGNNLISTKEENYKTTVEYKKILKNIDIDLKSIKQLNQRIINELGNFARKSELEILKKQMKMFEPLEFARIKDVKSMIDEELKKIKN